MQAVFQKNEILKNITKALQKRSLVRIKRDVSQKVKELENINI